MKIVFITHPKFVKSQSMPRFATMLAEGMGSRGHDVESWTASPLLVNIFAKGSFRKWLGYIDQYIIFPIVLRAKLTRQANDTLFVFVDHALGPWIPVFRKRHHVIHCHDFLAQFSALGLIPQNPTAFFGRCYQRYIRAGFSKARNFISVSEKTRIDLHQLMGRIPGVSEVVYNGLNRTFHSSCSSTARSEFGKRIGLDLSKGYILHVGGNQWYKNRKGAIAIYDTWMTHTSKQIPLVLIGESPSVEILSQRSVSKYQNSIHFVSDLEDEFVQLAYSGSSVFLFPSLAEGFGWPIAEAMACGAVVITTGEAPMTEVAGGGAVLIPKQEDSGAQAQWLKDCAAAVEKVVGLSNAERTRLLDVSYRNVQRFDSDKSLALIERIYKMILEQ